MPLKYIYKNVIQHNIYEDNNNMTNYEKLNA